MVNNDRDGNDCLESQMDALSYSKPAGQHPILSATDYNMGQLKPYTGSDGGAIRADTCDTRTSYGHV